MPKWIAIRVSATLTILGSVATLLFAGLMVWTGFFLPRPETLDPAFPFKGMMAGLGAFFAGFSVWGFLTAAGVFRRRGWARLSMIIFAVLLVGMGGSALIATLFIQLIKPPANANVTPQMMVSIRVAIAAVYGSMTAIGAWWLLLFNSSRAKQYFAEARGAAPAEGRRPLSISFIAWYLLIATLFGAVGAVLRLPGVLFGVLITGWSALAIYTALAAVNLYLGTGLLQLQESARIGAIVYFAIAAANCVATVMLPGLAGRMAAMEDALPRYLRGQSQMPIGTVWPFALIAAGFAAVPIWFLVRRRAAFARGSL